MSGLWIIQIRGSVFVDSRPEGGYAVGLSRKDRAKSVPTRKSESMRRTRVWSGVGPTGRFLGRRICLGAAAVLALVCSLTPVRSQAQTSPVRFEVTKYTIKAELFPSTHLLTAAARIDLVPKADLTTLDFELHSNLRVDKVLDATGQQVAFKQEGLSLSLSFLNPLPQGKSTSVTVNYGGSLVSADGGPVENLKLAYIGTEGSYLLYSGRWFPVSTNGLNRFAATMSITVPSDETVIASGKPSAPQRQPGRVTYTYQFDQSSFPGTVLAGRYVVQPATAVGADIALYLKPDHENFAASYGETAAKILAFFSDKFGPLPSAHLAVVEIEDGTVGGYTAPGVVAIASRGFSTQVNYRLLAHEISHQWWRCLVSPASPDDAFLDEGLATYSSAMYAQRAVGDAAFEDLMNEVAVGALTHEVKPPSRRRAACMSSRRNISPSSSRKGPWCSICSAGWWTTPPS